MLPRPLQLLQHVAALAVLLLLGLLAAHETPLSRADPVPQ